MEKENIGFLFDLDGVLIDSEKEYTRIWNEIDRIVPTGVKDFAIKIKGTTLSEILGQYFHPSLHEQVIGLLNEREQKMRYEWLPGAKDFLDFLKKQGYKAVLVTSSNEEKMRHLREELPELVGYFTDIVTADRISKSKPDPEGYLLGARILGAKPVRCAVFEDSRQGVTAGRAAGAFVVGLTTTLPENSLRDMADIIVPDLRAVDKEKLIKTLMTL
ncbi:MAG: HAD family hydrolase [Muribaculaceae bacterium]|nr:HAD family hydrolase [Muribaculaceae bacterium]